MDANPDEALGHWSTLVANLQEPPLEFYENVQAAIARLNIPDAKFERVEYREGGAFSGFREYLRIRRNRDVFDICAAPFGNGCFFSWWFAQEKPALPAIAAILILFGYLAVAGLFVEQFGLLQGPVFLILLVPILLFLARQMGKPETDDFILMLPFIGRFYDRFFSPITYYRVDTSHMFQKAVQAAMMQVVDQVTASKGIRALTELERKPEMRDFFKK